VVALTLCWRRHLPPLQSSVVLPLEEEEEGI
ncbi:hypothetical protein L195_g064091, partial [Trifolium pratense]